MGPGTGARGRGGARAAARLEKRSLSLAGHATSLALEPEFWTALEALAGARPLAALIAEIDRGRGARPLASACRVAALRAASSAAAAHDRQGPPDSGS